MELTSPYAVISEEFSIHFQTSENLEGAWVSAVIELTILGIERDGVLPGTTFWLLRSNFSEVHIRFSVPKSTAVSRIASTSRHVLKKA